MYRSTVNLNTKSSLHLLRKVLILYMQSHTEISVLIVGINFILYRIVSQYYNFVTR